MAVFVRVAGLHVGLLYLDFSSPRRARATGVRRLVPRVTSPRVRRLGSTSSRPPSARRRTCHEGALRLSISLFSWRTIIVIDCKCPADRPRQKNQQFMKTNSLGSSCFSLMTL